MRRSQHTPYWAAPKRRLPALRHFSDRGGTPLIQGLLKSPDHLFGPVCTTHLSPCSWPKVWGFKGAKKPVCAPQELAGRGTHRPTPRCPQALAHLVLAFAHSAGGRCAGATLGFEAGSAQLSSAVDSPGGGPKHRASVLPCRAKRKPRRGVPTEPEGARSSSPRANGQCKGHQVSITHAGDSRNSLLGGSAVRGT